MKKPINPKRSMIFYGGGLHNNLLYRLSLAALGIAIVLQFIMPFIYPIGGHDATIHLNWLEQFPRLFREGNLYPRWMPDSFYGFGSPAFYFYPPLTYWCASIISIIFPNSPVTIYQTLGLLATIASVVTCYWFLCSLVDSRRSAFIGSLIYGILPYRLVDLYLRNAISEHLAFIFLPLLFLGIESVLKSDAIKKKHIIFSVAISAIAWVGIFLSNIPAAVIAMYFVPLYALIRGRKKYVYKRLFAPLIGSLIGVMIAAIYLLPIQELKPALKIANLYLAVGPGYALADFNYGHYRYFFVGLLFSLLAGILLLYKLFRVKPADENKNIFIACKSILLISIVFQIPFVLRPLWHFLPLFELIQFTWRLNIVMVLVTAVCVSFYDRIRRKWSLSWFIALNSFVTIIIALGYFYTMNGAQWKYAALKGHIDAPEYISSHASDSIDLAKKIFEDHALDDLVSSPGDSVRFHIFSLGSTSIRFSLDKPYSVVPVRFHRMYFPTWKLRNHDGNEIALTSDSLGMINAVLPPIPAEYTLAIEESQQEKNGKIISIIGLSLLATVLLLTIFWQNPKAS